LEIFFLITHAAGADSLLITATPAGQENVFPGIAVPESLSANHNNWTLLRGITPVLPQITECLATNASILLAWPEFGWAGDYQYQIFRKTPAEQTWQLLTPQALSGTSYTDTDVQNGIAYQYILKVVDADGYASMASEIATATPVNFSFANYLLVVDETRDGTGTNINPTDTMVDDFYAAALTPISHSQWDLATQGAPSLETLGAYKVVLWHADDFSENLLINHQSLLSSYLLGGGKVIISGWKTASVLSQVFLDRFAGSVEIFYDNSASLISAESDVYPQLLVDQDKLVGPWNGMLPMIYTFSGQVQSLYTANMLPSANGQGRILAFRQDNLCLFGFPLYFMQAQGVRELLQQLLPELQPTAGEDPLASPIQAQLRAFPNPFNPSTTVTFSLPVSGAVSLSLYNPKGQKLMHLASGEYKAGTHSISLDGAKLSSGVYLLRLETPGTHLIRKITLMK